MQIYALLGSFDHEGDVLLGVYSTHEKAGAAMEVITSDKLCSYDSVYIEEGTLDSKWEPTYYGTLLQ